MPVNEASSRSILNAESASIDDENDAENATQLGMLADTVSSSEQPSEAQVEDSSRAKDAESRHSIRTQLQTLSTEDTRRLISSSEPGSKRAGRPRSTTTAVDDQLRSFLKENKNATARRAFQRLQELNGNTLNVSFETIRRRVRQFRSVAETPIKPALPHEMTMSTANAVQAYTIDLLERTRQSSKSMEDEKTSAVIAAANALLEDANIELPLPKSEKRKEYSAQVRALCVKKHLVEKATYATIGTELGISVSTVRAIVTHARTSGTVVSKPRSGRPRKTTDVVDRVILEALQEQSKCTARAIMDRLDKEHGVKVSCETVRRRVKDHTRQKLLSLQTTYVSDAHDDQPPKETVETETEGSAQPLNTDTEDVSDTREMEGEAEVGEKRSRGRYSTEIREKCVQLKDAGQCFRAIGSQLKMPHTTVRAIVSKARRTGSFDPMPRTGRPRKANEDVDRVIREFLENHPEGCTAKNVQMEVVRQLGVNLSCETVRRRLRELMSQDTRSKMILTGLSTASASELDADGTALV